MRNDSEFGGDSGGKICYFFLGEFSSIEFRVIFACRHCVLDALAVRRKGWKLGRCLHKEFRSGWWMRKHNEELPHIDDNLFVWVCLYACAA